MTAFSSPMTASARLAFVFCLALLGACSPPSNSSTGGSGEAATGSGEEAPQGSASPSAEHAEPEDGQPEPGEAGAPEGTGGVPTIEMVAPSAGVDVAALRRDCDAGNAEACSDLGEVTLPAGMQILNPAIPTPPQFEEVRALHQGACDSGVDMGCLRLALLISNEHLAREVPSGDAEQAEAILQRLCETNMLDACYHVARRGFEATNDHEATSRRLSELCRQGHDFSCQDLILRVEAGELPASSGDRLFAYQHLCSQIPQFCLGLGVMLATGDGVERDPATAFTHFVTACDGGFLHGCLNAGLAGFNDQVVPPEEAVGLWDRACSGGHGEACMRLAGLFWIGQPLPQDQERSLGYLERACGMHFSEACNQIRALCDEEGYEPACAVAPESSSTDE